MYKKRLGKWSIFKNKNKRRQPHMSVPERLSPTNSKVPISTTLDDGQYQPAWHIPLPSLRGSSPTDPYLHQEQALASIREWIETNFFSKRWNIEPSVKAGRSAGPAPKESASRELHAVFRFAFGLWRRGELAIATMAVRKAFLVLEAAVVDNSNPEMILHIINIIIDMVLRKEYYVLDLFLKQFSDFAGCVLPASHPIARVAANIRLIDEGLPFWLQQSLCLTINSFLSHLEGRYVQLPYLCWLKSVAEPIGNRQLARDPSVVERCTQTYGRGRPSLMSSTLTQSLVTLEYRARLGLSEGLDAWNLFKVQVFTINATQASMGSRWDLASQFWQDAADLESRFPWSHPINIVEKLLLAKDASTNAGDTARALELGEKASQRALAYVGGTATPA